MQTFKVGSLLLTLVLYIGLPAVGWGVNDLSGFFAIPQLLGYSISIVVFGVLAGFVIQRSGDRGSIQGKGQEDKFVPRQRIVRASVKLFHGTGDATSVVREDEYQAVIDEFLGYKSEKPGFRS